MQMGNSSYQCVVVRRGRASWFVYIRLLLLLLLPHLHIPQLTDWGRHYRSFIQRSLGSTELGSANRKWRWITEYYNLTTCLRCSTLHVHVMNFLYHHVSRGWCYPRDWPAVVNGLNCTKHKTSNPHYTTIIIRLHTGNSIESLTHARGKLSGLSFPHIM